MIKIRCTNLPAIYRQKKKKIEETNLEFIKKRKEEEALLSLKNDTKNGN